MLNIQELPETVRFDTTIRIHSEDPRELKRSKPCLQPYFRYNPPSWRRRSFCQVRCICHTFPCTVRYRTYQTNDGRVAVGAAHPSFFAFLAKAVEEAPRWVSSFFVASSLVPSLSVDVSDVKDAASVTVRFWSMVH